MLKGTDSTIWTAPKTKSPGALSVSALICWCFLDVIQREKVKKGRPAPQTGPTTECTNADFDNDNDEQCSRPMQCTVSLVKAMRQIARDQMLSAVESGDEKNQVIALQFLRRVGSRCEDPTN